MDAIDLAFEVMDMRSFSNLWFWIALAVMWSSASHWVMGIPHDMIHAARRQGGQAEVDLVDLARIYSARVLNVVDHALLLVIGFGCFWFTILATLAFYYDIELAQAVFFLMFPMIFVVWHSIRTARIVATTAREGEALYRALIWHRRMTQLIGMLAVFATAMYGMYQNFSASILN
ncbi:MAG TPA: component of SufBCD complex [Tabrizicola sp.]|nr:component of SufBCD complex [Tabrizicola sp.]